MSANGTKRRLGNVRFCAACGAATETAEAEIQASCPHRGARAGARRAQSQSRRNADRTREDLAKEQRRAARKEARKDACKAKRNYETPDRRERAQRFLREQLAHGPQRISDLEEAAGKAHVDPTALEQARADLGVVTSRGNAGGVQAVQWSLPPPPGPTVTIGR